MQTSKFFQALLHDLSDDCVFHLVVPTPFTIRLSTWKQIRSHLDMNVNEITKKAYRSGMFCTFCGNEQKGGEIARYCVRVLIAKKNNEYHVVTSSCIICFGCGQKRNLSSIESTGDMNLCISQTLEKTTTSLSPWDPTKSPRTIWEEIREKLCVPEERNALMKKIGRIKTHCRHCKAKNPKARCSGCHFTRYCKEDCLTLDWPKHVEECKMLRQIPLIYSIEKGIVFLEK